MNPESERKRLLNELDSSRRQLSNDLSDLGRAVNVKERIEDSVRRHPAWWIGGGVASGLLVAKLLGGNGRSREEPGEGKANSVKRSLFLGLLGIAGRQILRLSEPALKRYAEEEIERWLSSRHTGSTTPAANPTEAPID